MKNNKYKVMYSDFPKTKENDELLKKLSNLLKLNVLLNKKLITKNEYEKVKCAIGFTTPF